jgi:gliding motility-associated protein GldL
MSAGNSFFASKKFKTMMKFVYGIGGAVVIIGAMFKIMHWPGADVVLILGLTTEAVIFTLSAFEPLHEEYDWSVVYPELALTHDGEEDESHSKISSKAGSVTERLDEMLTEAKIEPQLLESLGSGLRNLSDNANKLGKLSDATAANDEFVSNLKDASGRVGKLASSYEEASSSIMGIVSSQGEGTSLGQEMAKVSKNLSELNSVYELQLSGSREYLEATNHVYKGINELMTNLNDSVEDTRQYKESMAQLSKNLTALNTVYGNMLSAMNINVNR